MRKCIHSVYLGIFLFATVLAGQSYIPVSIQMRDGKFLAADLYTIDTLTAKPTVLIQTPYNKNWYRILIDNPDWQVPFDSINYNYLIVDWRGFYGSAPADSTGYDRGLDGYDLVEWIASKPWSNGKVGTWGPSALGVIQFMTAKHRPPHLTCCVPVVSDPVFAYTDCYYGGDYIKELASMRDSLGFTPESLILAHYTYDAFWVFVEMLTDYPESISVPMLMVTGWYDHNNDAPMNFFYALRTRSDSLVRDKHKFMVGPWTHMGVGLLQQGELNYPAGVDSLRMISFRIFDYYLRGLSNGYEDEAVVRYYQLGEDVWCSTDDWFSESDSTDTLYFDQNGVLSDSPPMSSNPPDSFLYDPRDPSPSIGGNRFDPFDTLVIVGPRDQRDSVENRSDIAIYTTPIMTESLTIVGNLRVELYISSNCEDTDFSIRITDVYPDERSMLITEGIRRMRFRTSYSQEELMVPGDIYSVFIELKNIAYTFIPGHKMRVIVSSSDYPIFDINLNNGDSLYVPGDTVVATNKIYHEPNAYSIVILKTKSQPGIQEDNRRSHFNFKVAPLIFRNKTFLEFYLQEPACVNAKVYDVTGRKILTLLHEKLPAGLNTRSLNAAALPSGVYFVNVQIEDKFAGAIKIIRVD